MHRFLLVLAAVEAFSPPRTALSYKQHGATSAPMTLGRGGAIAAAAAFCSRARLLVLLSSPPISLSLQLGEDVTGGTMKTLFISGESTQLPMC